MEFPVRLPPFPGRSSSASTSCRAANTRSHRLLCTPDPVLGQTVPACGRPLSHVAARGRFADTPSAPWTPYAWHTTRLRLRPLSVCPGGVAKERKRKQLFTISWQLSWHVGNWLQLLILLLPLARRRLLPLAVRVNLQDGVGKYVLPTIVIDWSDRRRRKRTKGGTGMRCLLSLIESGCVAESGNRYK